MTRRRCQGECATLQPIGDMIHLGRGKYICPDCQAAAANGDSNEAAILADCQTLVDAGQAEWVDETDGKPPVRNGTTHEAANDLLAEAQQAGLPLTQGFTLPDAPPAAGALPAPSVQAADPRDLSMQDVAEQVEQRHDLANEPATDWPLRYGRISASALATFMRCPEQFRREYVHGQRRPASGTMTAGSCAHKALEAVDRFRMQEGEPPPAGWWEQWYDAKFDYEVTNAREGIDWKGEPAEWRERGKAATAAYLEHISGTYQPLAVEDVFTMRVPGCPVPVVGVTDLLTATHVVDRKFGSRAHTKPAPDWRVQGLVYVRATGKPMAWHSTGYPKKDGTCSWHSPAVAPDLELALSAETHTVASNIVRAQVKAILAMTAEFGIDQPWPGNLVHQWACDSCSFRTDGSCRWWNPKVASLL